MEPLPVKPHTISQQLHIFDCPMREIYTIKIQRGKDGEIDYLGYVPDSGTILCSFECADGAIFVMWTGESKRTKMRFSEAMAALEQGEMVRIISWPKGGKIFKLKNSLCLNLIPNIQMDSSWIFSEWELYEDPLQLKTFWEILPELKAGKKVKRKDWYRTMNLDEGRFVWGDGSGWDAFIESIEASDWIVCE